MGVRKATLEKIRFFKRLMLAGCTVRSSLKVLKMSENTYRRHRSLIWGDKQFVDALQRLLEGQSR